VSEPRTPPARGFPASSTVWNRRDHAGNTRKSSLREPDWILARDRSSARKRCPSRPCRQGDKHVPSDPRVNRRHLRRTPANIHLEIGAGRKKSEAGGLHKRAHLTGAALGTRFFLSCHIRNRRFLPCWPGQLSASCQPFSQPTSRPADGRCSRRRERQWLRRVSW